MNQQIMMQQQKILMLLIPQMQQPPLNPQGSQHSTPSQPAPSYPMGQMPFEPQFPMPVYRPHTASPDDSHIYASVFNGALSWGLFSRLLSSSFDGDVTRYLGAYGSGSIE
ncbi:hypothetical protein C1H46_008971 [Malus baccata]|uniref:Uncharacterized protein n=1 Tax=Malus baccata TaxID=106549 RepID=A0A540N2U9_MALBA|nr:hypothetical protein C1H46_008971 [Malus baccata]